MKKVLTICLFLSISIKTFAQTNASTMEKSFVKTKLGSIAVFVKKGNSDAMPVIFLHGVYFDHHLWDNQINAISDRTIIALDMPWHGESKDNVPPKWTLADCGDMLLSVLDSLKIPKTIAIGHSWGSMTILRAATKQPERFASVGLCNMPFEAGSTKQKWQFTMQHSVMMFRRFYRGQAAKSLFGKQTLKDKPLIINDLHTPMQKLTNRQIRLTDKYVILNADDAMPLIAQLKVPARALKGKEDYVPTPPNMETTIVNGGHISPLESQNDVIEFCRKVIHFH
jgi:3-oxoadipate enol-lactonase